MGRPLQVAEVTLDGAEPPHSWSFPLGVTVIVGAVGGGKTSLLNLIYFGLGGKTTLTEEVRAAGQGVTLEIRAGEREIKLSRLFDRPGQIEVGEADRPTTAFSTQSGTARPWISDLLLDALGVPAVTVRKSRAGKSHQLTRLSFLDLFAFLYLDQEQVDRATMFSDDRYRDPKRLWMFELLHGIIDKRITELEAEIEEIEERIGEREKRVVAVEDFAAEKELPLQSDEIARRLTAIAEQETALKVDLLASRERVNEAAADADEAREMAGNTERAYELARHQQHLTAAERDGVREAVNQLVRDVETFETGISAGEILSAIPYVRCPRCQQWLEDHPEERCKVCGQVEPPQGAPEGRRLEDLREQLAETRELLDELEAQESSLGSEVEKLGRELITQQRQIREAVADSTRPHLAETIRLEGRLAGLQAERQVLEQSRRMATAVSEERNELAELEPRIAPLEEESQKRRRSLGSSETRVDDLSREFDATLRRFTLPWLESAEVDRKTYLPRVNGRTLTELSSGGMKATTNAAYYLSILVTALRDRQILTPHFLMLDSIRKDYGGDEKDLARGEKIFAFLQTLDSMRHAQEALAADFQLIVVDNDLPPAFEGTFNTIRIDPGEPLIRTS